MRTFVTAAACLLVAGTLSGAAFGQARTEFLSPKVADAKYTLLSPKALEDRYPATRDYRRERVDMIVRAMGGVLATKTNGYGEYRSLVAGAAGVTSFAIEGSPVLKAANAAGGMFSGDDMLWAASGLKPEVPEAMAAEGRRVIEQFNASTLALRLDMLAEQTFFIPPIETANPAIAVMLPQLGEARATARLNAARMMLAMLDGDEKELVRATAHNLAVARASASETVLISHLVSVSIDALAMQTIIDGGMRGRLSPAVCKELLAVMDRFPGADWSVSVRADGLNSLDTLHWICTVGSITAVDRSISKVEAAASRLLWASRESILETADGYYEAASKAFDEDATVAAEARKAVAELDAKIQEKAFRAKYRPLAMLKPAMEQSIGVEAAVRGLRGAVRIMLAAELFKADKGEYPVKAEELVPAYLTSLPTDWFTLDRAPLRYVRVDPAKDRLGRSFLVYSVGLDGEDHGGKEDVRSNYSATQSPWYKGLDLVYNWREAPQDEK